MSNREKIENSMSNKGKISKDRSNSTIKSKPSAGKEESTQALENTGYPEDHDWEKTPIYR